MSIANKLAVLVLGQLHRQYGIRRKLREVVVSSVDDLATEKESEVRSGDVRCIYDLFTIDQGGFRVRIYLSPGKLDRVTSIKLDRFIENNPHDNRSLMTCNAMIDDVMVTSTGCLPPGDVLEGECARTLLMHEGMILTDEDGNGLDPT